MSAGEAEKVAGNAHFKAGEYLKAAASYTKAIKADPSNHVLYSNRAQAFLKINKVRAPRAARRRFVARARDEFQLAGQTAARSCAGAARAGRRARREAHIVRRGACSARPSATARARCARMGGARSRLSRAERGDARANRALDWWVMIAAVQTAGCEALDTPPHHVC